MRGSDDGELLMELRSAHAYTSPASAPQGRGDVFVMDSGAGFHVTPHRHMLQAYLEREHPMFPDFRWIIQRLLAGPTRLTRPINFVNHQIR